MTEDIPIGVMNVVIVFLVYFIGYYNGKNKGIIETAALYDDHLKWTLKP